MIDGRSAERPDPWGSFEPYVQLIRSLLPRATSVAIFDAAGELRWTSETTTGPDLVHLIEEILPHAREDRAGAGDLRMLAGNVPVYACWLRNDSAELIAIVAVVCRANGAGDAGESRSFSLTHAFLRPALECMRRDLLARALIDDLTGTVTALDRDLELLLTDDSRPGTSNSSETDELKGIVKQALEHLKCATAALIVPDKGIVLLRAAGEHSAADNQLIARTHRQLLSMAQMRREPVIINKLNASAGQQQVPYRILSCPLQTAGGKVSGVLALFRDASGAEFTARDARLADILARKAHGVIESNYDAMSGLYTRPAFEQRVRAVVAAAKKNASWSALYIDTDQLHVINDNFGMHVGDSVIGQLGELVRRRLPPGAFGARISGDRFAVLLPTALEDAAQFAESLREGVEQLGTMHGQTRMHVSISIGVALLDTESGDLMHSLAAAETACKAAKDRGRNRVESYQSADLSMVRRFTDINIAGRLREAIAEDRLRLEAQLITPLAGAGANARPHYELLLRMIDEDGHTLGPDRFLSAANRYQLMPTIDRWVIDKAIELLKPHAELLAGHAVSFAINFSGQSLNDDDFGDFLLARIGGSGIDPSAFCFELTENATIANVARAEVIMRRLRQLGCGVALDDFGTGLSSLSYLRQLPVTMLKIDGSFVRDILKDARSESMVHAIAQLARSMSIVTVAEYVETEEIHQRIAAMGVDYGQGFAIGRPVPIADVLAELPLLAAAHPVAVNDDTRAGLLAANLH